MSASLVPSGPRRTRTSPRVRRTALALLLAALAPCCVASDAPPPAQAPEAFGSHEFTDAGELAQWTSFETQHGWPDHLRRAQVVDGVLEIEPWTSGWYAEFHAPYL